MVWLTHHGLSKDTDLALWRCNVITEDYLMFSYLQCKHTSQVNQVFSPPELKPLKYSNILIDISPETTFYDFFINGPCFSLIRKLQDSYSYNFSKVSFVYICHLYYIEYYIELFFITSYLFYLNIPKCSSKLQLKWCIDLYQLFSLLQ